MTTRHEITISYLAFSATLTILLCRPLTVLFSFTFSWACLSYVYFHEVAHVSVAIGYMGQDIGLLVYITLISSYGQ